MAIAKQNETDFQNEAKIHFVLCFSTRAVEGKHDADGFKRKFHPFEEVSLLPGVGQLGQLSRRLRATFRKRLGQALTFAEADSLNGTHATAIHPRVLLTVG